MVILKLWVEVAIETQFQVKWVQFRAIVHIITLRLQSYITLFQTFKSSSDNLSKHIQKVGQTLQ